MLSFSPSAISLGISPPHGSLWAICLCHLLTACHRNILFCCHKTMLVWRCASAANGQILGAEQQKGFQMSELKPVNCSEVICCYSIASIIASSSTSLRKTIKISLWCSQRCSTFFSAGVGFHLVSDLRNYQRLTGIELFKVNLDKQHAHKPEGGRLNWSHRKRPG